MIITIYLILGIITLTTLLITYLSYKNQNSLFKFWLILLIFNLLIIVTITAIIMLYNPTQNATDDAINHNQQGQEQQNDITVPDVDLPIENKVPISDTASQNVKTNNSNNFTYIYLTTIFYFAINSLLAIFVYRDSSARTGVTGGVAWAVLIFLSSIIGLGLYLLIRPVGNIRVCKNCKKLALETLPYCPYCYDKNELFKEEHNKEDVIIDETKNEVNQ